MGFPEQLKKARLDKGYTQQQIADLMGITKSAYCGYETGKRQPDVAKIKQLARILNISGDVLLETGFGNEKDDPNSLLGAQEQQLLIFFRLLNDEGKEKVIDYISDLVDTRKYKKPAPHRMAQ